MTEDIISTISQEWFLNEPALFQVFCTHQVERNPQMSCPIRVGRGKIEYNPNICESLPARQLEELMKAEAIRILLKHPYDRQPSGCKGEAKALGSNCVLSDGYRFQTIEMDKAKDFKLPVKQHFEYYAKCIQRLLPPGQKGLSGEDGQSDEGDELDGNGEGMSGGSSSSAKGDTKNPQSPEANKQKKSASLNDLAELWQEDELMSAQINQAIRGINQWGSLPGGLVQEIVASTKGRVDYRKILAGFRASIISQKRRLTRMRPNRRSGFEAMGSRYDFCTRMIVGVDVSASISDNDLQNFYSTINNFFKYGISQIDVVQFDTVLGEVNTIEKASTKVKVKGRGGTDFQPFINYVSKHPEYDGALIYTDGCAPEPMLPTPFTTHLMWVVRSAQELVANKEWMKKSGRVCLIEMDRD